MPMCRGSTEIRTQVSALPALRLHLFGHSHNGYGLYQENGITFSNGALMAYDIRIEREPRMIEL